MQHRGVKVKLSQYQRQKELKVTLDDMIAELRELNETIPKPLRLPTPNEIESAERRLDYEFHPDYRKYLLESSDIVYGVLEPCTVTSGGGHTDLVEIAESAWRTGDVPRELLPICSDNADHYCMNEAGEVLFCPHDGTSDEKWPNLATWIKQVWIEKG
jgi:hypothetical protein